MNVSHPNPGERVRDVHFTEGTLAVDLEDRQDDYRSFGLVPAVVRGKMEQHSRWKVAGAGYGIHWPDLDEDLSTEGFFRGAPAAAGPARLRR